MRITKNFVLTLKEKQLHHCGFFSTFKLPATTKNIFMTYP